MKAQQFRERVLWILDSESLIIHEKETSNGSIVSTIVVGLERILCLLEDEDLVLHDERTSSGSITSTMVVGQAKPTMAIFCPK